MTEAIRALITYDLTQFWREKIRIVSSLIRPLMWFFIIGNGFKPIVTGVGENAYQSYLVPGMLGMMLLFGGVLNALMMAKNKNSPIMRLLLLAPLPHTYLIYIRITSAALIAIQQTLLLIGIIFLMGLFPSQVQLVSLMLSLLLGAIVFAALGILIAVIAESLENFTVIMNFVIFPLFFLSGALYPIHTTPWLMKTLMFINPMSYSVDLIQHAFLMQNLTYYTKTQDILGLCLFFIFFTLWACLKFTKRFIFSKD